MKHIFVALTVVIVVAAYSYDRKVNETVIEKSISTAQQSVAEESVITDEKIQNLGVHPPVDWESISERMDNFTLGDTFTDEEIEAYNALHVIPLNPVTQYECPPEDEFARMSEAHFELQQQAFEKDPTNVIPFDNPCIIIYERPEHFYAQLPLDELKYFAYHDAIAAIHMGSRYLEDNLHTFFLIDTPPQYEDTLATWFLRAAALSKKSGPIMTLIRTRYQEPATPHAFVRRIALEVVAQTLGDPRANPNEWKKGLEKELTLMGTQDQLIEGIILSQQLANTYLEEMISVQQHVTGETQVLDLISSVGVHDA